jgi:NADH:ubiquinone oxidoreductase subunit E
MLVNRRVYGDLTPEKINEVLETCRSKAKLKEAR